MMWIIWIILGLVVVFVILVVIGQVVENKGGIIPDNQTLQAKRQSSKKRNISNETKKPPKFNNEMSVSQIVSNIDNLRDLKSIENKSESFALKFFNTNKKEYEVLAKKFDDAFRIAEEKIFKVQFIPDYEINTPLLILEQSYKLVDGKNMLFEGIENIDKYGSWDEYTGNSLSYGTLKENIEPKPDYWKSVIKFRKIIENDELITEKRKALIKLIQSDKEFKENFFSDEMDEIEEQLKEYIKLP